MLDGTFEKSIDPAVKPRTRIGIQHAACWPPALGDDTDVGSGGGHRSDRGQLSGVVAAAYLGDGRERSAEPGPDSLREHVDGMVGC